MMIATSRMIRRSRRSLFLVSGCWLAVLTNLGCLPFESISVDPKEYQNWRFVVIDTWFEIYLVIDVSSTALGS